MRPTSSSSRTSIRRTPTSSSPATPRRSGTAGRRNCGGCTGRPRTSSRTSRSPPTTRGSNSPTGTSRRTERYPGGTTRSARPTDQLDRGRFVHALAPRRKLGPRLRDPALLLVVVHRGRPGHLRRRPGFDQSVLTGNHTNVGKIFAQYQFPLPPERRRLPARADRPAVAGAESSNRSPTAPTTSTRRRRGTRTMPTWTNFDWLSAYYDFLIGPTDISARGTASSTSSTRSRRLTVDPDFYVNGTDNTGAQPALRTAPTSYAPPRRFIILGDPSVSDETLS